MIIYESTVKKVSDSYILKELKNAIEYVSIDRYKLIKTVNNSNEIGVYYKLPIAILGTPEFVKKLKFGKKYIDAMNFHLMHHEFTTKVASKSGSEIVILAWFGKYSKSPVRRNCTVSVSYKKNDPDNIYVHIWVNRKTDLDKIQNEM